MDLNGRSFIITGGTRGIGRGLADALLAEGARVAICGRDRKSLGEALKTLRAGGREVVGMAADVGNDSDAKRVAQVTLNQFGRVDFLINNAAVLAKPQPVVDTSPEDWEQVLRVNVIGTVNMIRHVLPSMRKEGSGVIVNLTSGWGRTASARVASYCASKFAVEGLTQSVAAEAGPGVVVFALNPGVVATEMLARSGEGDLKGYPSPQDLAPRWLRLLQGVKAAWNGKSLDLDSI